MYGMSRIVYTAENRLKRLISREEVEIAEFIAEQLRGTIEYLRGYLEATPAERDSPEFQPIFPQIGPYDLASMSEEGQLLQWLRDRLKKFGPAEPSPDEAKGQQELIREATQVLQKVKAIVPPLPTPRSES